MTELFTGRPILSSGKKFYPVYGPCDNFPTLNRPIVHEYFETIEECEKYIKDSE